MKSVIAVAVGLAAAVVLPWSAGATDTLTVPQLWARENDTDWALSAQPLFTVTEAEAARILPGLLPRGAVAKPVTPKAYTGSNRLLEQYGENAYARQTELLLAEYMDEGVLPPFEVLSVPQRQMIFHAARGYELTIDGQTYGALLWAIPRKDLPALQVGTLDSAAAPIYETVERDMSRKALGQRLTARGERTVDREQAVMFEKLAKLARLTGGLTIKRTDKKPYRPIMTVHKVERLAPQSGPDQMTVYVQTVVLDESGRILRLQTRLRAEKDTVWGLIIVNPIDTK